MSVPPWLHGVRSTTVSGGPSALTPHAAVSITIAPSVASLFMSVLGPPRLFLDDQPALHLEVQRRAELGAVVAVGARLLHHELDGRRLTRIEADHHVLDRKSTRLNSS